jgi:galactoside O-acetyltransferase
MNEEEIQMSFSNKKYQLEYNAFAIMINGKKIPLFSMIVLIIKSFLAIFEGLIRNIPGGFGFIIRYYYYKFFLKKLGKNVLIDIGVCLNGPANISIGDYVWIDSNCKIEAMLGEVTIGRRVHIAPFSLIAAREPIVIGDYVGISSSVKIYSNSEHPIDGKRMSGPMIPEEYKAFHSQPIILHKDSFVGTNSVLLPGAELGEGAVVGANTIVQKKVEPWTIVVGPSAKVIGHREKVTVPDI